MHAITQQWDRDHHYDADHVFGRAPQGRPCDYCGGQIRDGGTGLFMHLTCLERELVDLYSRLRDRTGEPRHIQHQYPKKAD
jgi:hypothetical protein